MADRAIDKVLDPLFVANLRGLSDADIRKRHDLAQEVERELSAERRALHRIIDALDRELRAREEDR